jgi:UDP-N-acetylmuramoyl-tripeptide--D-alanyl-D-alanine ligase
MDIRLFILWAAADRRLKSDKPFVIAVTGSVAKTSTKEAVGAVLKAAYGESQVRVGFGNLNTALGLPLAILGYEIDFYKQKITWQWPFLLAGAWWRGFTSRLPHYLVIEMGADQPGDMKELTRHIQPDIGVLTVVGEAHLMNYRSQEQLADEKAEIIRATKPAGTIIVNRRDPFFSRHLKAARSQVLEIDCPVAETAKTVAETVGKQLGIEPKIINQSLEGAWQPSGRMQIRRGAYTIIDDSYNASPTSMNAAFETLAKLPGRKVAILGSMLELGQNEVRYHEAVGRRARDAAEFVIGVGGLAKHYNPDHWFADSSAAAKGVVAFLKKGDSILVKGSHGIRMDKIVEALEHS